MDRFKNIYEVKKKSSGLNDGLHMGRGREGVCSGGVSGLSNHVGGTRSNCLG